jgi:Tol biopolymer transport system component/DNA-binding winged helix-turn-helix (wHTH) protein
MSRFRFDAYEVDADEEQLYYQGVPVPLPRRTFSLLLLLVRNADRTTTKQEIFQKVWSFQSVDESNLTQQIYLLRRTLQSHGNTNDYIRTVQGVGYRFLVPVEDGDEAPPPVPRQAKSTTMTKKRWIVAGALLLLTLCGGGVLTWNWTFAKKGGADPSYIARPLVSLPGMESYPEFSPDGKFLAFTWDGGDEYNDDIYVQKIENGALRRLTTDPRVDHQVVWAPDGKSLAFLRESAQITGAYHLMIVDLEGEEGEEREVARVWGGLDWSPDGNWLVVSTHRKELSPTLLYLISPDGKELQQLTSEGAIVDLYDSFPRFSPDGKEVAFVRWKSDVGDLWVVNLATKQMRQLTFFQGQIKSPRWSQDGSHIIFTSSHTGRFFVWKIPVEGGEPTRLVGINDEVQQLTINRQTGAIAYTQRYDDTVIEVRPLVDAKGGISPNPNRCLINSSRTEFSPRFSPDGKQILFSSERSGWDEIWVANVDCKDAKQLTDFRQKGVGSPRWSFDGESIVFDRRISGKSKIFLLRLHDRHLQQITDHPWADMNPAFSPDGKWIYYTSEREDRLQIWKTHIQDGTTLPVTKLGGREPLLTQDQRMIYTRQHHLQEMNLATGLERPVIELAGYPVDRFWDVVDRSIYFLPRGGREEKPIYRFDLDSRQIKSISKLQGSYFLWEPGLSISPDKKVLAVSYFYHRMGDILLAQPTSPVPTKPLKRA